MPSKAQNIKHRTTQYILSLYNHATILIIIIHVSYQNNISNNQISFTATTRILCKIICIYLYNHIYDITLCTYQIPGSIQTRGYVQD